MEESGNMVVQLSQPVAPVLLTKVKRRAPRSERTMVFRLVNRKHSDFAAFAAEWHSRS